MKIAIIGGGPAGLYAAILLKKQRPKADITVYERNRSDDTFGLVHGDLLSSSPDATVGPIVIEVATTIAVRPRPRPSMRRG